MQGKPGTGWKYDRRYDKIGGSCTPVKIPANGYVVVPEKAHINYSGEERDCHRPYRKQVDHCVVP